MADYSLHTPTKIADALASRARNLRLVRGWKQATLAERSGVSLASLRRFERTGRASLQNLLRIALALNRLDEFDSLFRTPEPRSIADLERRDRIGIPKRGRT